MSRNFIRGPFGLPTLESDAAGRASRSVLQRKARPLFISTPAIQLIFRDDVRAARRVAVPRPLRMLLRTMRAPGAARVSRALAGQTCRRQERGETSRGPRGAAHAPRCVITLAMRAILVIAMLALAGASRTSLADPPAPAIAMHGAPALPPDFAALPYVDRRRGRRAARLRLAYLGTLRQPQSRSTSKRSPPPKASTTTCFQTLMARSRDEPFTLYGLIAQSIETDASRDYATFRLDPRAHFSDGAPITAEDIRFSFELLRTRRGGRSSAQLSAWSNPSRRRTR